MALRAGLRTCGAPLLRPPAGLDLGSPARPAAPSGSRRPEPARAPVSARPARNSTAARGGRAGPDGDTAALSLLPPAGLYKLGPPPSLECPPPRFPRRPGAPRHPSLPSAVRARAGPPGLAGAAGPETSVRAPPEAPTQPSAVTRTVPMGRSSLGVPRPGTRGGGQYKRTPNDLNPLPTPPPVAPTCNCAPRGWSNFRFAPQAVMAQRPLGAVSCSEFPTVALTATLARPWWLGWRDIVLPWHQTAASHRGLYWGFGTASSHNRSHCVAWS